jgi:GTPase
VSIKEFKEKVMKLQEVIDVKEIDGYDSNVLVIVKNKSDEIIRKIARIALEVNSKYDSTVNFYISTEY